MSRLNYNALKRRGFSVFMDMEDIREGDFDLTILRSIESCDYFLPILATGTLDQERINNPDDWVRKEIEYSLP